MFDKRRSAGDLAHIHYYGEHGYAYHTRGGFQKPVPFGCWFKVYRISDLLRSKADQVSDILYFILLVLDQKDGLKHTLLASYLCRLRNKRHK